MSTEMCHCGGCAGSKHPLAHWGNDGPHKLLGRELGGWIDHPYRLIENGETVWISEPYCLTDAAFAEFGFLRQSGYDVFVTARNARHKPGGSISVRVTRRNPRPPTCNTANAKENPR